MCSSRGAADYFAGVPALLAVAAGAAAYGLLARSWPPPRGLDAMPTFVRAIVEDLHVQRPVLSLGSLVLAGVLAVDAASLSLLELFDWMNVDPAFDWGHVAVTGLWSLVALSAARARCPSARSCSRSAGSRSSASRSPRSPSSRCPSSITSAAGRLSFSPAPVSLLRCSTACSPRGRCRLSPAAAVTFSALLSGFASYQLLSGDRFGYGLLAAASAHVLVAAARSGASVSSRLASGLRAPCWRSLPRMTCSTARGSSSLWPAARSRGRPRPDTAGAAPLARVGVVDRDRRRLHARRARAAGRLRPREQCPGRRRSGSPARRSRARLAVPLAPALRDRGRGRPVDRRQHRRREARPGVDACRPRALRRLALDPRRRRGALDGWRED